MNEPDGMPLQTLAARLMLAGVTSSAACMAVGLLMYLGLADLSTANAVVTFGLIVLMATPAVRVAISVLEALRTGDWLFVALTASVVLVLGLTLGLALTGG